MHKFLLGLVLLNSLYGCATPAQRVDKLAAKFGFERKIIDSKNFQHIVYFNTSFNDSYNNSFNNSLGNLESENQVPDFGAAGLHIYLEGDGSPWLQRKVVAIDPTPRNPLALTLMAKDSQPSVYIGRPCYFGFSQSDVCNPLLWTHQRYAQIVVNSLTEVANKIITEQKFKRVKLIGYSGGGVLAMLMADNILQIDSVVTIAANLDTDAWAKHHKYSILEGSLNPAKQPPLKPEIRQWHLVGNEDKNVPPRLVQRVIDQQVGTTKLISFDGYDHICCWSEQWPTILSTLQ